MKAREYNKEQAQEILNRHRSGYQITEYVDRWSPIKIKHDVCGEEYYYDWRWLTRGDRFCQCLNPKRPKSDDEFIEIINEHTNNNFDILGIHHISGRSYCTIKCKRCGHEHKWRMDSLLVTKGDPCPKCTKLEWQETWEKNIKDYFLEHAIDLEITGIYWKVHGVYNNKIQIHPCVKYKCTTCGLEYDRDFYDICGSKYQVLREDSRFHDLDIVQCVCHGRRSKKYWTEQFMKSEMSQNFDFIDIEYNKYYCNKRMIFYALKCKKCGRVDSFPADHVFRGITCECSRFVSLGEASIIKLLDQYGKKYKKEYTFPDLYDYKASLFRFDFAVFNEDELQCLIEYDGEQHYKPVDIWGGKKGLKIRQSSDKKKNKYCIDHNIRLIRIPYWEFDNIEQILLNEGVL